MQCIIVTARTAQIVQSADLHPMSAAPASALAPHPDFEPAPEPALVLGSAPAAYWVSVECSVSLQRPATHVATAAPAPEAVKVSKAALARRTMVAGQTSHFSATERRNSRASEMLEGPLRRRLWIRAHLRAWERALS